MPNTPRSSIRIIMPGSDQGTRTIGVDELDDKAWSIDMLVE